MFPRVHGMTLAAGAYVENFAIERLASDPTLTEAGHIWYNTTTKTFMSTTLNVGGSVITAPLSSSTDLAALTARVDVLETDVAELQTESLNRDGSVAMTANLPAGGFLITGLGTPVADTDSANKLYVDDAIAALGTPMRYIGTVAGGLVGSPFDLAGLSDTDSGAFYKVTTAGYVTYESVVTQVHLNDAIIFNTTGGYDVLAGQEATVSGTANQIDVAGTVDSGWTISLSAVFVARVTALETDLAAEIVRAEAAEAALQSDINQEVTDRGTADTALGVRIDTLTSSINSRTFTQKTTTPALQHIIAHNLNSEFLIYTITVENETDDLFYGDLVGVQETDADTLTIDLTVAANVKVVIQNVAAVDSTP